jgi:hypothetical protein
MIQATTYGYGPNMIRTRTNCGPFSTYTVSSGSFVQNFLIPGPTNGRVAPVAGQIVSMPGLDLKVRRNVLPGGVVEGQYTQWFRPLAICATSVAAWNALICTDALTANGYANWYVFLQSLGTVADEAPGGNELGDRYWQAFGTNVGFLAAVLNQANCRMIFNAVNADSTGTINQMSPAYMMNGSNLAGNLDTNAIQEVSRLEILESQARWNLTTDVVTRAAGSTFCNTNLVTMRPAIREVLIQRDGKHISLGFTPQTISTVNMW